MTNDHTNHTYTYKTLVVDGVVYNLNQTQPAKNLGWLDRQRRSAVATRRERQRHRLS